ncbi:hypothetical protein ACHAWO_007811 [Cyclotella atomus]|uniref:Uncharacterized protein n=1 Tax=Cyclotella atomus TaxID=382360 RepID=A0ABD3QQG3_9STRA
MSNFSPTNFELTDDSPVQNGRKHRRGRAHNSSKNSSFKTSGNPSSAVSSSLQQSPRDSQPQYYTADSWDTNPNNLYYNSKNRDDNSCAGSLTYSASSSVQSGMSSGGESSNDSSFADIIKLIDKEGEGANAINAFIAAKTEAADEGGHAGGGSAVAGWVHRVNQRQQLHSAKAASERQGKYPTRANNVSLNYSKDDSDDEEFGENVLETITGDEEVARRHNITVTTRSARSTSPKEESRVSPYNAVNPSRHDTVTPPPSNRSKRSSTPPGRNYSPRSKSSSDGSWDTPTASPPGSNSRPPHSRGTGASNSRRQSTGSKETAQDISEAVYAKFWMCGFTDSFNFDNLKRGHN